MLSKQANESKTNNQIRVSIRQMINCDKVQNAQIILKKGHFNQAWYLIMCTLAYYVSDD